jgi:hypothetical protein
MLKRLFILLLLFSLGSCIDPYRISLPDGERLLTVDGYITTDFGPHRITLTRSDTYGSVFEGLIRPVSQALVALRDSQGEVIFLTEVLPGAYETPRSFRAKVGLSYVLQITLQDGKEYTSLPELVSPVPAIDSLSYRSVQVATDSRVFDRSGVQIIASFRDPADQANFYYWRTIPGTFVVVANPELHTFPPNHPTNPRGPNPKDCCATCFLVDPTRINGFSIASDEDFNGLSNRLPVAFIEDNGLRFKRTYRAEIQQLGISAQAHRFLRLVEQQVSLTGSVFDQPPANIRGNMISLTNPDETVLGYFIAASVDSKQIYIENERLQFLQTPRVIPDDCRTVTGATVDPPVDWNPPRN